MVRSDAEMPSREELIALVSAQAAEIALLKVRLAELERRLGLNSSNSGKPPSSDGLNKPPRVSSLREKSGKKSGGQKGHKGTTLLQSDKPDEIIDHFPAICEGCGTALAPDMAQSHVARQVFDLPPPQPLLVTEHRAHDCRCGACGTVTRGAFPAGVNAPVQYGDRISAFVVYLLHWQFVPESRLASLMADLFGVCLSAATLARMSQCCATRLAGFAATVRGLVAVAPVKHMDETGFRIGGKTQWLHVASTTLLTFYRTCTRRGSLLANTIGIVVHDHWKPYFTMPDVQHALCNAHHLRELKALIEIEKEDWARRMTVLLRRACHAANLAHNRGKPLNLWLIAGFTRRFETIVAQGLAFHAALPPLANPQKAKRQGPVPRRTGHNLLLRFQARQADVLRFLSNPAVPFTNNEAERDARMMKLRQKISGGFRSSEGAADFAIIRSFVSTARKQGWNIIQALSQDPADLAKALRMA